MTCFEEGELQLSFDDEWDAEHFDRRGAKGFPPKSVSPVDFIAERADELVLVEVKDPSAAGAANRQEFVEKMKSKKLTHEELVPKARTSYGFLHLMARDTKPMRYVVVIGIEHLSLQPPLLMNLTDSLRKRLAQESDTEWKRTYISECVVVSVEDVGKGLPGCSVRRRTAHRGSTEQST